MRHVAHVRLYLSAGDSIRGNLIRNVTAEAGTRAGTCMHHELMRSVSRDQRLTCCSFTAQEAGCRCLQRNCPSEVQSTEGEGGDSLRLQSSTIHDEKINIK